MLCYLIVLLNVNASHVLTFQAAVRAMDTVQDISLKFANVTVSRFVVAGASKVCSRIYN